MDNTSKSQIKNQRLFGTAGIRALWGENQGQINDLFGLRFGLALAYTQTRMASVVVGRDVRTTSDVLCKAIKVGLTAGGYNVVDIGINPIPVLAFIQRHLKSNLGVYVTASHNPPEYNGIKVFGKGGREFYPWEEKQAEQFYFDNSLSSVSWDKIGTVKKLPTTGLIYKEHANRFLRNFPQSDRSERQRKNLRVVIDCGNGVAGKYTPRIIHDLGCQIISINTEENGFFPGRSPEPREENLKSLMTDVVSQAADFGIAHDGDADRIALIDERGRFIFMDRLLAFFAGYFTKRGKETGTKPVVVTSVDSSSLIESEVEKVGGRVVRCPLGQLHVETFSPRRKTKKHEKIVFAGEPWKHIIPEWGPWIDGIISAGIIVRLLQTNQTSISQMFDHIPKRIQNRKGINCPNEIKSTVMKLVQPELLTTFKEYIDMWSFDGIRLQFNDGAWILIRASGTQPMIRVYVEAQKKYRAIQLMNRGTKLVQGLIQQCAKL